MRTTLPMIAPTARLSTQKSESDHGSGTHAFVTCKGYAQTIHGILHMIRKIKIGPDGFHKKCLFSITQFLMIRFVCEIYPGIRFRELIGSIDISMMHTDGFCFGMCRYRV
jgi:hypothetical protein